MRFAGDYERDSRLRSRWMNIMYSRIPLLDPDAFLKSILPLLRCVISRVGGLVWLGVVIFGIKVIIDRAPMFRDQSQAILAPGNIAFLYLSFVLVKAWHEFGHAAVCRRLGGEVHVMGLMLMIFTPVPYVDTTSSWAFRSRWKRALVGAAGMIAELFAAAIAAGVWAYTAPGTINSLAYNVIFVASVSTVVFNVNPLLRFDGYYIVSDLLDIPNLQARATRQLTYLAERYLFGCKEIRSQSWTLREAVWLTSYGLASQIYRLFVFTAIVLLLSERFLILGVIMALVCAASWVVVPVVRLVKYLSASPRLGRQRTRAVAVSVGGLALLIGCLGIVPAPNRFRAPGVLESIEHRIISAETPGRLEEILAKPGQAVRSGDPLLRLSNHELELDLQGAQAELDEALALRAHAEQEAISDVEPIESRIAAIEKRRAKLKKEQEMLVVRAPHDGIWIEREVEDHQGAWLARGKTLGEVVNPQAFQFCAIISQEDASRLFAGEIRSGEVRLFGRSEVALPVSARKVIPADRNTLPSAALGWRSGGEVAISPTDTTGLTAREPFFEMRALVGAPPGVRLLDGRSGKIRFDLPPEPLLGQWLRKLDQLLQQRYGL